MQHFLHGFCYFWCQMGNNPRQGYLLRFGLFAGLLLLLSWSAGLWAADAGSLAHDDSGHSDPIAPVILGVTGMLAFALVGRFVARRFGQPSVLGELIIGIIAGNLLYFLGVDLVLILREGTAIFDIVELVVQDNMLELAVHRVMGGGPGSEELLTVLKGPNANELIQIAHVVDVFSRYGIIFLLFLAGLESSLSELSKSGAASGRVAIVGVVAPLLLGYVSTTLIAPELQFNTKLFIAATLGATSVGITAAVLSELGRLRSTEAQVIMGAAVIDDILGLITLAIITGIVVEGSIDLAGVTGIVFWTAVFLTSAFYLGPPILKYMIPLVRRLNLMEAKLFISFLFVMALAWLANLVGLATIIGAFAAGLILHDGYFEHWGKEHNTRQSIKDLVAPLETMWVPIFFVLIGIQVKLESFLHWEVLSLAVALTLVAIFGKLVCGLVAGRNLNGLAIGVGMMPRGEVGLVFATLGKNLGVVSDQVFSALVLMVIVTAVIAPPLLKYSLRTGGGSPAGD